MTPPSSPDALIQRKMQELERRLVDEGCAGHEETGCMRDDYDVLLEEWCLNCLASSVLSALASSQEEIASLRATQDQMAWAEKANRAELQQAEEALRAAERARDEIERKYRERLWLGHGHQGIYGDDGEMQCAECAPIGAWDYKRDPLEAVERAMMLARAKLAEALTAAPASGAEQP